MAKRRIFTPQKKVEIIREHLENSVSISSLCEKYNILPTQIYAWKKQLFEGALDTFNKTKKKKNNQKIQEFKEKIQLKDTLISELVADNVKLKKNLNGEI